MINILKPFGELVIHSMGKIVHSFRSKMIIFLVLSMLLSGLITYFIYKQLQYYYHANVRAEDSLAQVRLIISSFGDVNFFLLFFIPLSILLFFILTKPYSTYFDEISRGIHRLANGDFNKKVFIRSNDEFKKIAHDINVASDKLQEAIKRGDFAESSKDQLIVNLAHDLRTPLTSVLGYLDLILKDEELSSDQIKHYSTIAYTKSQRLEKLINELFEITKMNYGMIPLKKAPIHLSELLIQLVEEMYPLFEKHQLNARINITNQLKINGDGELLARVFENLLINAIRHGKDGQYIDLNGFMDEEKVVIQVINYGDEISPEARDHLFDPFYTDDKARSHGNSGTGLGLFIAKNIVERHGGVITADSCFIETKFEIRLPG